MHVALIDCGVKENILRSLVSRGQYILVKNPQLPYRKCTIRDDPGVREIWTCPRCLIARVSATGSPVMQHCISAYHDPPIFTAKTDSNSYRLLCDLFSVRLPYTQSRYVGNGLETPKFDAPCCTDDTDGKLAHHFDGVFISNGPGDPTHCVETVKVIEFKFLSTKFC